MKRASAVASVAFALAASASMLPTTASAQGLRDRLGDVERGGDRYALGERQDRASEFDFRSRMTDAIETVAGACADDIDDFCGRLSPGAGRLAMCMRAYKDQFSRRCQATLDRV